MMATTASSSEIKHQIEELASENRKLQAQLDQRDIQIHLLTKVLTQSSRLTKNPASPSQSLTTRRSPLPYPLCRIRHSPPTRRKEPLNLDQLSESPRTKEPKISSLPSHFSVTYRNDYRFARTFTIDRLNNRDSFLMLADLDFCSLCAADLLTKDVKVKLHAVPNESQALGYAIFYGMFLDDHRTDWKAADSRINEMMRSVAAKYVTEKKGLRWMIWDDDVEEEEPDWVGDEDAIDFEGMETRRGIVQDWEKQRTSEASS